MTDCKEQLNVDFIVLQGDATLAALEDDIRTNLEQVGVTVNTRFLAKADLNTAMTSGDFNLCFSETWGPPYDPHSYAASWDTPDEAYYAALSGLPAPKNQAWIADKVDAVLEEEDESERYTKWIEILTALHEQATEIPLSGKAIPAIFNAARVSGYQKGLQQFDYPIHTLRVIAGSKNLTLTPGGQTGNFVGVGRLDPHSYRPNEFFANNWVYEGLVEYGTDGTILPSLASSWTVEDEGNGQKYTFNLRQGVQFHDGESWNCTVAKVNFDHVLAEELTTGDWHGWYGLPAQLTNWSCPSEFLLELTTSGKYYPLLQELSYIRPLRMLSPAKFVGGITSDPYTSNSCPSGWGHIPGTSGRPNVTCAGTSGIAGTGRWEYVETIYNNETSGDVNTVTFKRNANHWSASADTTQLDYVHLKKYETSAEVKNALASGELDAVIGAGVLENEDVADFQTNSSFTVSLTESFQNRVVIFNTAKAPTDDLETRKMIIHAVNKADIIDRELAGIDAPVDSLFPKNAPYCDIHFTPTWDFDLEKARLLCGAGDSSSSSSSVDGGILAMALIFAALVMMLTGMLCFMRNREINGKPLFRPLVAADRKQVEMRA